MIGQWHKLRIVAVWIGVLVTASLTGCGPAGSVRLVQPQLAGWQREVSLETEQVQWAGTAASAENGVERILAEFPLPGARVGQPMYLLYLRLPAGKSVVSFGGQGQSDGRGFLIQARDKYAGLTIIAQGEAKISGTSQASNAVRNVRLNLQCEDGSKIEGVLHARRNDWHVSRFETQRRPADVQALHDNPHDSPTTQKADR